MRRNKNRIPSKYVLFILTILCVVLLFFNYATGFSGDFLQSVANYIFVPMQDGLNYIGDRISVSNSDAQTKEELIAENEQLKSQVEELQTDLTNVQMQQSELENLQELFDLSQTYGNYQTTGARVIAKGTSNWFETFTIDKGEKDGIKKNMNVIAGSGLVGIVTETGRNYSVVRSIIDDTSNVSGMVLSTGDNCIVSGNLKLMTQSSMISFSDLQDDDDQVKAGDAIVTSNISDKYVPGLLIGYINSVESDSSGLTKEGTITPVVDFKHLQDVLVILDLKETTD